MIALAGIGRLEPFVLLTAPSPYPGLPLPLSVVKLPPMTTFEASGDTSMPYALPLASTGAQPVVAPLLAFAAAARPGRETPAAELKFPAKYAVVEVAVTAKTSPLADAA